MKFYKVQKTVHATVEITVVARDEDEAYDIAYDLPDNVWELSGEWEIDRKPDSVTDVTPAEWSNVPV